MRRFFPLLILAFCLVSCNDGTPGRHFITDRAYLATVRSTLDRRLSDHDGALRPFLALDYSEASLTCNNGYVNDSKITVPEEEALEFLYAYMPLADVTDYPTDFYLQNIRASFQAREAFSWGAEIPEIIFRHFVLPIRVNNENLDTSRVVFFRELKPRVEGLTMAEAILEVNHWCHEKVT